MISFKEYLKESLGSSDHPISNLKIKSHDKYDSGNHMKKYHPIKHDAKDGGTLYAHHESYHNAHDGKTNHSSYYVHVTKSDKKYPHLFDKQNSVVASISSAQHDHDYKTPKKDRKKVSGYIAKVKGVSSFPTKNTKFRSYSAAHNHILKTIGSKSHEKLKDKQRDSYVAGLKSAGYSYKYFSQDGNRS